jgi:DNA-binding protein HU-beta
MNQSELIAKVVEVSGLTRREVEHALKTAGDVVRDVLADGGEVTLPGIGKLVTVRKAARTARNPTTGSTFTVAAKQVVKFRVAKALKDAVA